MHQKVDYKNASIRIVATSKWGIDLLYLYKWTHEANDRRYSSFKTFGVGIRGLRFGITIGGRLKR